VRLSTMLVASGSLLSDRSYTGLCWLRRRAQAASDSFTRRMVFCQLRRRLASTTSKARSAVARDYLGAEPRAVTAPRRSSSAPHRELKRHRRPFCRQESSATVMTCSGPRLLSACDASLSGPETCPGPDRGSEPVALPAAAWPEASPDTLRLHDAGTHADALACIHCIAAGPDRSDHRNEAEPDTARNSRAGTPTTTRNSMPPFSGHGARTVMTSRSSRRRRTPESLGLPPWAFANLAGALLYAAP